ncbi:MAG: hypothetical protein LBD49_02115 [Oscillospiraceae bacterium]|nr:hypothetical protein [Oscillospiraceae bacterium]
MKIKTIFALAIAAVALAALVVGVVYAASYILESTGDPSRFSFVGITANGISLGMDAGEADASGAEVDYSAPDGRIVSYRVPAGDGLDLWVEWINVARNLSVDGAKNIDDVRMFLKGRGKKTWSDKESGIRRETYEDVLNKIAISFEYNDADGSLIWFTAEQEQ